MSRCKGVCTKLFASLLMILLLCGTSSPLFSIKVQAATVSRQYGDVNWDGKVDSKDAALIKQHNSASSAAKIKKAHPDWILKGDDFKVADVNRDGKVDSKDYKKVLEYNSAAANQNVRKSHPEWYKYLDRYYKYKTKLKLSTRKVNLGLKGSKTCKVSVKHNYGRACYLKFVTIGTPLASMKLNGWDKTHKTYTITLKAVKTGSFSFRADLYDTGNNKRIVSSDLVTVNVKKRYTGSQYKKYNLTNKQLKKIAKLCQREQGSVKGAKAEASLMANQLETSKARRNIYGSGANGLYEWVRYGGWFGNAAYWMDHGSVSPAVLAGVKDVLVNGNRVLPVYVDEHDCISDIISISTGNPNNRNQYKKKKTIVRNRYGSKWTFWCFPDSHTDPFGYTDAAYKAAKKK